MDGRADLAVHSARTCRPRSFRTDSPSSLSPRARTCATCSSRARGDGVLPRAAGRPVGRRGARHLELAPPLAAARGACRTWTLVDIRGNVQTRLRKVEVRGDEAGPCWRPGWPASGWLARARLRLLCSDEMLPAVGQGSLAYRGVRGRRRPARAGRAAPGRADGDRRAERARTPSLEGGCQVPIAALGEAGADGLRCAPSARSTKNRRAPRRAGAAEPEALGPRPRRGPARRGRRRHPPCGARQAADG